MALEDSLFGPMLTSDAMAEATSARAWVEAMLAFESALARAEAGVGLVPPEAATEIGRACAEGGFDPAVLGDQARLSGNPAVALVARLRSLLPPGLASYAHLGATSQDALDTATMLVLRRAGELVTVDLVRLAEGSAGLAARYRSTPMAGRTLLQQARPTTFGCKAAGWLVAVLAAAAGVRHALDHALAVQLGGPVGTLDGLGGRGPAVVEALAGELGLSVPLLAWHNERSRVVVWAGALAVAAGTAAKIALDVALLMQSEVGEAAEPAAPGRGGSSSMPHKRNPALSVAVQAAWRTAQHQHGLLLGAMVGEHERAAGAWQAEPHALSELCRAVGAAVSVTADMVAGLEVSPERMAANLRLMGPDGQPGEAMAASVAGAEDCVDRALAHYRSRKESQHHG